MGSNDVIVHLMVWKKIPNFPFPTENSLVFLSKSHVIHLNLKSYLTSFVEANMSQEVKGMLDQIRKEIKEATSSADGDGRESPSL